MCVEDPSVERVNHGRAEPLHVTRQKHEFHAGSDQGLSNRLVEFRSVRMSPRRQVDRRYTGLTSRINAPECPLLLTTTTTRAGIRPVAQASSTL